MTKENSSLGMGILLCGNVYLLCLIVSCDALNLVIH